MKRFNFFIVLLTVVIFLAGCQVKTSEEISRDEKIRALMVSIQPGDMLVVGNLDRFQSNLIFIATTDYDGLFIAGSAPVNTRNSNRISIKDILFILDLGSGNGFFYVVRKEGVSHAISSMMRIGGSNCPDKDILRAFN